MTDEGRSDPSERGSEVPLASRPRVGRHHRPVREGHALAPMVRPAGAHDHEAEADDREQAERQAENRGRPRRVVRCQNRLGGVGL